VKAAIVDEVFLLRRNYLDIFNFPSKHQFFVKMLLLTVTRI